MAVFIELGAKIEVHTRSNNESLLQVAFRKKYPKTIKVLLDQVKSKPYYIKQAIKVT